MGVSFSQAEAESGASEEADGLFAPDNPESEGSEDAAEAEEQPEGGEEKPEKADESEALFDGKEKPPLSEGNYMRMPRFRELRQQRDDAREAHLQAQPYKDLALRLYGSAENPLEAMEFDIKILDAFSELQRTDPVVREAARKVRAAVDGGAEVRVEKSKDSSGGELSRAERTLLVRDAQREIESLAGRVGIVPRYRDRMVEEIAKSLRDAEDDELLSFDRQSAMERAKEWIQKGKYSQQELTGKAAKTASRSAPASRGADPGSGGSRSAKDETPSSNTAVKNMDDWERRQESRLASVAREIGGMLGRP